MPTIAADELSEFVQRIYEAVGVPSSTAELVAGEQTKANLAGHDSHGVHLALNYVASIRRGFIVPTAKIELLRESPATAVIDGHWGFGFVCTRRAAEVVIAKAQSTGIAAATVRHQSHVGRLSPYTQLMAEHGLIGVATADSGMGPKHVAPFGGRSALLGTNPLSIAAPTKRHGVAVIDMATAAVALGKIRVAAARGASIPFGWMVDVDGRPTTDPSEHDRGGVLLPLGADQGHKGYGLSFMVEVLSGLLTGIGYGVDPQGRTNDGVFLAAFDVDAFIDRDEFEDEISAFIDHLKQSPLAVGHSEIFFPGEVEQRTTHLRLREGIWVEDTTWARLSALADELGVELPVG